jgi:hypothetical protein
MLMKLLLKLLPVFFSWVVFISVILFVKYPESLTQSSFLQLIAFFIPLYFGLVFTINLAFNNIPSSSALSLGIVLLLVLKALRAVNNLTVILIIVAVGLLISYFRNPKSPRLTSGRFVPKLRALRKKK